MTTLAMRFIWGNLPAMSRPPPCTPVVAHSALAALHVCGDLRAACAQRTLPLDRLESRHGRYGGHRRAARAASSSSTVPLGGNNSTASSTRTEFSRFQALTKHARMTHIAHEFWAQVLRHGDVAVDATCGNGHDTIELARLVGSTGKVFAFDVQSAAIYATRDAVEAAIEEAQRPMLEMRLRCHSLMDQEVGRSVARLVCFNLGYLPGSDKSLATQPSTTLKALEAALDVLMPGGLLSVLAYTGHQGGQEEYEAVRGLVSTLPTEHWLTSELRLLNRPSAPVLMVVYRALQ